MNVRIRLFAQQRQLTGWRERTIDLPDGSPISAAWDALVREWPVLAPGTNSVRFARNAVYADPNEKLFDGDELAVIPPVAGGCAADRGNAASMEPAANVIRATTRHRCTGRAAKVSNAPWQNLIHHASRPATNPAHGSEASQPLAGAKVATNDYLGRQVSAESTLAGRVVREHLG